MSYLAKGERRAPIPLSYLEVFVERKTLPAEFEAVFADHRDAVFNLLFRLTGDHHASEDLFQEVFLKVYGGLDRFDGRSALRTWITSIALNVFRDFLRKKRRREALSLNDLPGAAQVEDGARSPEEALLAEDERNEVQQALNGLRDTLRVPVVLFYIEGLPVKEVAAATGRTESDIKVSLHRARRILKKKWEKKP